MNLLWNILLAGIWAAITGEFTFGNLLIGFMLGFLVMFLSRRQTREKTYFRRTIALADLILFTAWELVMANLRLAVHVISPRLRTRPGIIAIPLDARTDEEITMLANLITLTPGTLSIDVSDDRRTLYIHAIHVDKPHKIVNAIKQRLERRVLEAMR